MPQHLHRREFIQASAAAAGMIAVGLPRAARAASWMTIDAQVHAYERNHLGRPWAGTLVGPEEMTGDQMVAAMDAVGVNGAVLVSPFSMYRYDASYVLEVEAKHPDRFCLVKPVDPSDPAVADHIADWKTKKGVVGFASSCSIRSQPILPIPVLTGCSRRPQRTRWQLTCCARAGWNRSHNWLPAIRTRSSSSTTSAYGSRSNHHRQRSPGPNCRRCWRSRPILMLPSRSPAPAHCRTSRSRTETSGTRSAAFSTPSASTDVCGAPHWTRAIKLLTYAGGSMRSAWRTCPMLTVPS